MTNAHPTANRVPTPIALMLITVSKKNTLNRLSGQFGTFKRGKKNIANATKQIEHRVIRSTTKKALERNTTLQSSRGLNIDEIGGSGNSLGPKVRQKRCGNPQRTGRLKKVTMLALRHAILSMSTRTRELSKSTLLSKKCVQ
jgi:hypothetical protein